MFSLRFTIVAQVISRIYAHQLSMDGEWSMLFVKVLNRLGLEHLAITLSLYKTADTLLPFLQRIPIGVTLSLRLTPCRKNATKFSLLLSAPGVLPAPVPRSPGPWHSTSSRPFAAALFSYTVFWRRSTSWRHRRLEHAMNLVFNAISWTWLPMRRHSTIASLTNADESSW